MLRMVSPGMMGRSVRDVGWSRKGAGLMERGVAGEEEEGEEESEA